MIFKTDGSFAAVVCRVICWGLRTCYPRHLYSSSSSLSSASTDVNERACVIIPILLAQTDVNKGNSQKLQIDERISQVPVLCIIVVWKADL